MFSVVRLGKDETSGEIASEGTAVDTGDAASSAATDSFGVFAGEVRKDLATRGAMKKQFLKNLFSKEVAAVS